MATPTIPVITALEAEACASLYLSDRLPDRFSASEPSFDADAAAWRVPVFLSYPIVGPVGRVGEIVVSSASEQVLSHTPINDMLAAARLLYEQHRERIEASLS
jgi:hypothetical protein